MPTSNLAKIRQVRVSRESHNFMQIFPRIFLKISKKVIQNLVLQKMLRWGKLFGGFILS